jgi:hypothetical protein
MKRFSMSLLLIGALLTGTAKAQATMVVVAPGPYYRPYYGAYYGYPAHYRYPASYRRVYYRYPRSWARPYHYAPAPVAAAPLLPLAVGIGFHIR